MNDLDKIGDEIIAKYLDRIDEFTKEELIETVVLAMKWETKKLLKK